MSRNLIAAATSPKGRFFAFTIFLASVFLMGGGSRDDIKSLALLRPLAVFFVGYALMSTNRQSLRGRMYPLLLLFGMICLLVVQIIPLAPSIWTMFPERQIYADIANIADIDQPWRPISLSPSKTINSLFSLIIPLATMLLYLNLDTKYRSLSVVVIVLLMFLSAICAIFQIVGGPGNPFYLYRITNEGAPVGLFANRNHQAVMLVITIFLAGWLGSTLRRQSQMDLALASLSGLSILIIVPLIFITGSRTGLILMIPALLLSIYFFYSNENIWLTSAHSKSKRQYSMTRALTTDRRFQVLAASLLVVIVLSGASIYLSRSLAFDRLIASNQTEELRSELLPVLIDMTEKYMPVGAGFGAFEHIFEIYETKDLLKPAYLNQAHNDWLQFAIEGGVVGLAILTLLLLWLIGKSTTLMRYRKASRVSSQMALMCLSAIACLGVASIGDYPLRVPSIMAVFSIFLCLLHDAVAALSNNEKAVPKRYRKKDE